MLRHKESTLAPLDSVPKSLAARSRYVLLCAGLRDIFRLSSGTKIGAGDQWN
jgi:hypothetical protein